MSYGDCRFEFDGGGYVYTPNPYETYDPEDEYEAEAEECRICGEEFYPDMWGDYPLEDGVCRSCIEENATLPNLTAAGDFSKDDPEINGFFAFAFSPSEIDKILEEKFKEMLLHNPDKAKKIIFEYIDNDPGYFPQFIKKEE